MNDVAHRISNQAGAHSEMNARRIALLVILLAGTAALILSFVDWTPAKTPGAGVFQSTRPDPSVQSRVDAATDTTLTRTRIEKESGAQSLSPKMDSQPSGEITKEEQRKTRANSIFSLARGVAPPPGGDPIDIIISDHYWNPKKVLLSYADREKLKNLLDDCRVEVDKSQSIHLQTLAKTGARALEEGRYEEASPTIPVAASSGFVWLTEKDGRTVKIILDPAKYPDVRESLTMLDDTKGKFHDAVIQFFKNNGTELK
ncbi:MAG: hypothetical protein ACKVS6_04835 [Planctomycetota bacterium]